MDWQQLMQAVGPYLGAMPSQQAPTPGQGAMAGPANPQAQPKMQYGAGDIIGSPLLQGALQGYFGYLAGGRGESPLQRLGTGGLMGLQGYAQGRANQLAAPLRAAELKKTQAEAAKTGMETQQLQQQITGRQAFAKAFRETSTYKSMNPQQAELTAAGLAAGIYKPTDIMRSPVQQQEFDLKLRQMQGLEKYRTGELDIRRQTAASEDAQRAWERQHGNEVLGLESARLGLENANLAERTKMDQARLGALKGTGPITAKEEAGLEKQAHDMAVKDAGPAPRPPAYGGRVGDFTGSNAKADADYRAKLQQWQGNVAGFEARDEAKLMNRLTANRGARRSAAMAGSDEGGGEPAGGAPPPLPAGGVSYHVLPDGTLGYRDASGNFVPFGE